MPRHAYAVASIRREHVGAFIAAELVRTALSSAATRYRSLQQLFKWLDDEGEISGSPMIKMRPPIIPEQPVPVLSDDQVRPHCPKVSGVIGAGVRVFGAGLRSGGMLIAVA
jgi:site-specific recombinase XerD